MTCARLVAVVLLVSVATTVGAQQPTPAAQPTKPVQPPTPPAQPATKPPAQPPVQAPANPAKPAGNASPSAPIGVQVTPDYVIGPDDVITVVVWKEEDVSGDFTVRPDGKISLPLMNDVSVAGLTPEQLRARITEAAAKFIEDPTVTIVVKEIKSRKVFVMGQVAKPGPYPLIGPGRVVQLLATAGGLLEYANEENISIVRTENGRQKSYRFNYKDFTRGRNLDQNIELKPGDQIIVPE